MLNVSTLISCILCISLQLPSHSLLWRAILQHILLKHKPDLQFKDQQVGRIASKSANFLDYVRKGFAKLGLTLEVVNFFLNFRAKNYDFFLDVFRRNHGDA